MLSKSDTGAADNDAAYIGLDSTDMAWYRLDAQVKDRKWTALAAFPGRPRDQATSASIDGSLYVFGGTDKNNEGLTQVLNDVHEYNPRTNSRAKLMSHAPIDMVGHVTLVHNGKVYVTGGVNQGIFNDYLEGLNEAGKGSTATDKVNAHYFDKKAEDYFFNKFLLSFDPSTQQWSYTGGSPWYGTADAAVVDKGDKTWLINGEAEPGLRMDAVFELDFTDNSLKWNKPAPVSSSGGVTDGFAGIDNDSLMSVGGAGFKGSQESHQSDKNYAHESLEKSCSTDIHLWHNGKWDESGELSQGRVYGVSLPWNNSLLTIGSEVAGGKAVTDSVLISVKDNRITV